MTHNIELLWQNREDIRYEIIFYEPNKDFEFVSTRRICCDFVKGYFRVHAHFSVQNNVYHSFILWKN
jgi:hypothetical protein